MLSRGNILTNWQKTKLCVLFYWRILLKQGLRWEKFGQNFFVDFSLKKKKIKLLAMRQIYEHVFLLMLFVPCVNTLTLICLDSNASLFLKEHKKENFNF